MDIHELYSWLEAHRLNLCHWVTVDTFDHLKHGGRVSATSAAMGTLLGIKPLIHVDDNGKLVAMGKPRGQKKATETLAAMVRERGFRDDSWLRIAHCFGETQAQLLIDAVRKDFPNARYTIEPTGALCSFYAEEGGLMIALEGSFNQVNNVNGI